MSTTPPDGTSFAAALCDQARLLAHVRAAKAADTLRQALDTLSPAPAGQQAPAGQHASHPDAPERARQLLTAGLAARRPGWATRTRPRWRCTARSAAGTS
jgi:hypothetical protein